MEQKKPLVLIAEDHSVNRKILCNILREEYRTLEACNGQEALNLMTERGSEIAAVLLDITMPVMNGYEFLTQLSKTDHANTPVIVLTGETDSEEEALDHGAWDFVAKPFKADILLRRLRNTIARSQIYLLDQFQYLTNHDALTGIYNRRHFLETCQEILSMNRGKAFVMVHCDIIHFRLVNSFWAETEGDRLLKYIAAALERIVGIRTDAAYGRISGDVFAFCEPYDESLLRSQISQFNKLLREYRANYFVQPAIGVYVIDDLELPVEKMFERASMAAEKRKSQPAPEAVWYDERMSQQLYWEKLVLDEMQSALDSGQFILYFQPKYNLDDGCPWGAEALVRWQHPKFGMIPPGSFIPIFERNGLIRKLDYYVWETACRCLRGWLDQGIKVAPISVNISRVNMYNPQLVQLLSNLVRKYRIPPELLNLELTESAYMDNPDIMKTIIQRLHKRGFLIMMDDFGSGYSSLNMLKDIPVDVLKIDMKFLSSKTVRDDRSSRILSSIIWMAGWLNLPVIMEGVETQAQMEFLQSIGCGYVQGYYFSRPMPVEDYESLIRAKRQLPLKQTGDRHEILARAIWSQDPQVGLIFNGIQQPLAFFSFGGTVLRPLRVNPAFNQWFDSNSGLRDLNEQTGIHIAPEDREKILNVFVRATADGRSSGDYWRTDRPGCRRNIRIAVTYLGQNLLNAVYLAVFSDRTPELPSEDTLSQASVENMPDLSAEGWNSDSVRLAIVP